MKYEVNTLFRVTQETAELAQNDNVNWPGVPFRFFQLGTAVNQPVYDVGTYSLLTNLDNSIHEYLLPGAVVKYISNVATLDPSGNTKIDEEHILVRLIYARSAKEYIIPETGEIVYPEIQTEYFAETGEFAFVNDYVGIIKKKYLESFVMENQGL